MNKKQKKRLKRIVVASTLFVISFLPLWYFKYALLLAAYVIAGYDVVIKAAKCVRRLNFSDESLLMSIATFGAVITAEYTEAAFVMLFYQVGELFSSVAVSDSRKSISALMSLCPDSVTVLNDGEQIETEPESVTVGQKIIVRAGERIALDGIIESGATELDCSHLTGEAVPVPAKVGDEICSGSINLTGVITVRVTKPASESTVSRILKLTETATESKAESESIVKKFAKVYTPIVLLLSAVIAFIVPIFTGGFVTWFYRACTLLVISCPCALVLSVPLAFFCGIGRLTKKGVLVKGGNAVERLARISKIRLDKTGTLTDGTLTVKEADPQVLQLAAALEQYSDHPIARAVVTAYGKQPQTAQNVCEYAGYGVTGIVAGEKIAVGNARLIEKECGEAPKTAASLYVAKNGKLIGSLTLGDRLKSTTKQAISELYKMGINDICVLSGDNKENVEKTAKESGIKDYIHSMLPENKTDAVSGDGVLYAGDGINDAPALAKAYAGVSMGSLASDAATEAADVVIADGDLLKIPFAIKSARDIMSRVYCNTAIVVLVKILAIILGAAGIAGMWAAVFSDVGVLVIAVLNSIRK